MKAKHSLEPSHYKLYYLFVCFTAALFLPSYIVILIFPSFFMKLQKFLFSFRLKNGWMKIKENTYIQQMEMELVLHRLVVFSFVRNVPMYVGMAIVKSWKRKIWNWFGIKLKVSVVKIGNDVVPFAIKLDSASLLVIEMNYGSCKWCWCRLWFFLHA